jgi:anti-sigma regulatory factor (Ser/Thr protein kinase)
MKVFNKQIRQVYNTSYKDELFVVEDMKNIISKKIFNRVNIYVLVKDFTKKTLLSSLSIVKYNNEIKHFDSTKELERYLEEKNIPYLTNNQKKRNLKICDGKRYPISLVIEGKRNHISDSIFDELLNSLCEIVIGTINYDNLSMEHNQRKIRKLEKKIVDSPDFRWDNLCQFINEEEKIKAGYFELSPQKEIERDKFISDFKLPFLDELQTKDGYKTYKPFFKESILSGKSIIFFDNKTTNYIAIIPAIRRYQAPKFIKEIFIIWSEQRIKKYKIFIIKDYIDCLRKQEWSQKTSFLSKIQAEVIKKFGGNGYKDKDKLLSDFTAFSEKCLKQIIKTTYAYSAVVRLYNANKNALAAFTVECNQWGKWNGCEIDDKKKDIELKKQHCSVNAFVFTKALNLEESYVYINHLKKPIPEKYKENGLNDRLIFRKSSMSEICFPLFVGKVPFGVLNIESPIIDAFDNNDIHYLLSIKQTIESFYDISIKATDSNWLAARSPVYTNVHEIEQLLRKRDFFTKEQLLHLEPLILFEKNDIMDNCEITLDTLREDINKYLEDKINKLDKNKVNLLYWHIKREISINNDVFTKIKLIVFNLIENIIKHSDIRRDTIDFSIDFTNKKIQILKILVTTYGTFGEDDFSSLTFSPVLREQKYHYGMFLVGMLSRNLEGTCYVEKKENKNEKFTIIEVIIPLNGVML